MYQINLTVFNVSRDVYKNLLNFYDGTFLQKSLMAY